jgi:Protein of unknown function (DUF664)
VLWKLDGLSEYNIRRPLTPTSTNLLGLVKHLARIVSGRHVLCKTWRPLSSLRDRPLPFGSNPGFSLWCLAAAGQPLEAAHGDDQARCAPGGDDCQIDPTQPGAGRVRVVDGQQGVGEGVDG